MKKNIYGLIVIFLMLVMITPVKAEEDVRVVGEEEINPLQEEIDIVPIQEELDIVPYDDVDGIMAKEPRDTSPAAKKAEEIEKEKEDEWVMYFIIGAVVVVGLGGVITYFSKGKKDITEIKKD